MDVSITIPKSRKLNYIIYITQNVVLTVYDNTDKKDEEENNADEALLYNIYIPTFNRSNDYKTGMGVTTGVYTFKLKTHNISTYVASGYTLCVHRYTMRPNPMITLYVLIKNTFVR